MSLSSSAIMGQINGRVDASICSHHVCHLHQRVYHMIFYSLCGCVHGAGMIKSRSPSATIVSGSAEPPHSGKLLKTQQCIQNQSSEWAHIFMIGNKRPQQIKTMGDKSIPAVPETDYSAGDLDSHVRHCGAFGRLPGRAAGTTRHSPNEKRSWLALLTRPTFEQAMRF
jgi:hypothetical protein